MAGDAVTFAQEAAQYPTCPQCGLPRIPAGTIGTVRGCWCQYISGFQANPATPGTVWAVPVRTPEQRARDSALRVERDAQAARGRRAAAEDYFQRLVAERVPKKWRGGLEPYRGLMITAIVTALREADET